MAIWTMDPWYESRKKIRRVIGNNICLLFYLLFILRIEPGNNTKFALTVRAAKYDIRCMCRETLKVPKLEIFVTELFILSDPIWVGDLRTEPKKPHV